MILKELIDQIPDFSSWSHADKVKLFAWHLHQYANVERFAPSQITAYYDSFSLERPSNISSSLLRLSEKRPKELLKDGRGYFLEKRIRDALQDKYGERQATVQAAKVLLDLPLKIPDLAEKIFLDEAIRCFKCYAFRAAIVMTWNLAYDHLCNLVLQKHLLTFQNQWPTTYPKHRKNQDIAQLAKREDFADLKESEVLQVCKSANIITNDLFKIFNEKLGKRNTAAHPSTVEIAPHTAEEFIIDLVTNGVLKLV